LSRNTRHLGQRREPWAGRREVVTVVTMWPNTP
jgi:hypothetical protein